MMVVQNKEEMNGFWKILLWILVLSICSSAAHAQMHDTVYLKNGQVLIGDVKNIQLGVLSIDDQDLHIVKVKVYKIVRLATKNDVFRIETVFKETYIGMLRPSSLEGHVYFVEPKGTRDVLLTDIDYLIPIRNNFFRRLDGSVTAGFSYTKSSGIGQLTFSSSVRYNTKRIENQLSVSSISSIDSSTLSRDREDITLFTNYNFSSTWFFAGSLNYQRNLELSIKRRLQELIGLGRKLLVRNDLALLAVTGMAFSQERSTDNVSSGLLLELPVMFRFTFYKFQHPNLQISTAPTTYFGLTQWGRIRFDSNTSFSWELIRDFSLTITPYTSFDSRPPSASSSKFDFGIVLGLSYIF